MTGSTRATPSAPLAARKDCKNLTNIYSYEGRHPAIEVEGIWIDQEIAPLIKKLWAKGVVTWSCCQGDDNHWGHIMVGYPYDVGPSAYQAALATAKRLATLFLTIATIHAPDLVADLPVEKLSWRQPESTTEPGLSVRFDHRLLPTLTSHIDSYLEQQNDIETVQRALQNP